jgi:undecaprenyl-diphosphatase
MPFLPWLEAIALGTLQGLSEFLPVSSSAHLYVVPRLLNWKYNGLAFDVALHWGTLIALLLAYGDVWLALSRDALVGAPAARAKAWDTWSKLAVASVPAAVAGVLLKDVAESALRFLPLQAATLAGFGLLLWWVDRAAPQREDAETPGWLTCVLMGAAQAVALVPGVSRSGITITAGRARGLTRVSAARFSFLLATPITFGAGLLELRHLPADLPMGPLAAGVVSAAVVGLFAIRGLIRWLGRAGFGAFFAYRAALAAVIMIGWWMHQ